MNGESFYGCILIIIAIIITIIFMTDNINECFINDYYSLDWNDPQMLTKSNNAGWMENSVSCNYTDDAFEWCLNSYDVPEYKYGRLRSHGT
jgi:hypothetical protein